MRCLQRFYGVVTFLAMDCEVTPENREHAARQTVRAFPTFEIYFEGRLIEQVLLQFALQLIRSQPIGPGFVLHLISASLVLLLRQQ